MLDASVKINDYAEIITMSSGERKIFFGLCLKLCRGGEDVCFDYKNDIPLTYITDFEEWLAGGEAKKNVKKKGGLFAPFIGEFKSFFYLPDDGYFKPDEKTGIKRCPNGSVHIKRIKCPGDYGKETSEILLLPDEYRILVSEAKNT